MDREIIELTYGDDYFAADNRAIVFDLTSQPSITSATIALILDTSPATSFTGSVVTATQCRIELTSTQVASIGIGYFGYDLQATLANGHVVTLRKGILHVAEDIR